MNVDEFLQYLHCMPNRDLQKLNTETNRILMARYDEELKRSNEYQANYAIKLTETKNEYFYTRIKPNGQPRP